MKKTQWIGFLLPLLFLNVHLVAQDHDMPCDVLIGGILAFDLGIGKISYGLIDYLADSLTLRYCSSGVFSLGQDPYHIKDKVIEVHQKTDANFFLYIDSLPGILHGDYHEFLGNNTIKCAYSMFEATGIPLVCAQYLNEHFDAVLVPDPFLIEAYQLSGVRIPIFCIPTGLYLDAFLNLKAPEIQHSPFVFGCMANRWVRKNLKKLITLFYEQFGNDERYKLKIHASGYYCGESLEDYVKQLGATTVDISSEMLDEAECVEFIHSCDCYILLSKGEGFSNTPREALAAGIPVIISDNTGHTTICNSGFVKAIPTSLVFDAWDEAFLTVVGKQFDCDDTAVKKAMVDVVINYQQALVQAAQGREWVKQYQWSVIKDQFLTFFNPQTVVLGNSNRVDSATSTLETNDSNFYHKVVHIRTLHDHTK